MYIDARCSVCGDTDAAHIGIIEMRLCARCLSLMLRDMLADADFTRAEFSRFCVCVEEDMLIRRSADAKFLSE